jgi:hypothetical protein
MNKVIRLTESDLVNIVKSVINEQTKGYNNVSQIDWSNQKNAQKSLTNVQKNNNSTNACPAGFVKMSQQEISNYDNSITKPWSTTDGSDKFRVLQKGKIICKRVTSKASGDPVQLTNPFEGYTLDEVASGFRDVISGIGGTIAQIIISGLGGHVINMVAWGLLVAYDIYYWVKNGTVDWFNLLHDTFWLLLSGVGGKVMGALKPLIKGESNLLKIFTKLSKTKSWTYIKSILSKISSYTSTAVTKITQALKTIISKFPSLKTLLKPLMNVLNRVGGVFKTIDDTFVQFTKLSVKKGTTEYIKSDIRGKALNATIGQLK